MIRGHRRHRRHRGLRGGYVFLISVLVIGVIAIAMVTSLTLLGLASQQSGLSVQQSAQAYEFAHACAERAFLNLRSDLTYDGGTVIEWDEGSCSVAHTGGSGNADRSLCVTGVSGNSTRRLQIAIERVYPAIKIISWEEVSSFTLCP